MKRKYFYPLAFLLTLFFASCEDEEYKVPEPKKGLQNDCIKRSLGPNVAGLDMEFAYAMALLPEEGTLVSARVEASIPGGAQTYLEHQSYYTSGGGIDVGVQIGDPSTTEGGVTQVIFNRDTSAATLRYFYRVPPEAKGQKVSFTFSATDSQGRTVSYPMGPYDVSKVDMTLDKALSNNNMAYISIEDMTVYNATDAAANPDKIDLVYLYRSIAGKNFGHALVAPAADPQYLPGVTLPAGVSRNTKINKTWNLRDFHLARTIASSVYVDDRDFETLDLANAPNFAINMKAEAGAWVETADGKYRAYIYINAAANTGTMTISMKRYTL